MGKLSVPNIEYLFVVLDYVFLFILLKGSILCWRAFSAKEDEGFKATELCGVLHLILMIFVHCEVVRHKARWQSSMLKEKSFKMKNQSIWFQWIWYSHKWCEMKKLAQQLDKLNWNYFIFFLPKTIQRKRSTNCPKVQKTNKILS